jgi:hypothetical protein
MARRTSRTLCGFAAVCFLVWGCGPGGGGGGGGHPPSISTLTLSSDLAVVDPGTGTATLAGTLKFADSGGDVALLMLGSSQPGTATFPITGVQGVTSGTLQGTFTVTPGRYGTFPFDVWLVDQAGASSNHLAATVTFTPDDRGIRWTQVSNLPAAALVRAAGPSHAKYVAVGSAGLILTSQDGTVWVQQSSPVTANLRGIAWSGSRFVAVGDGPTLLTSDDGFAWTGQASPVASGTLNAVSWGGGAFVAVGSEGFGPGALVLRSADGVSWTKGTGCEQDLSRTLYDVVWGGGRWVAVAAWRWTSTDGLTWSRAPGDYSGYYSFAVGWNGAGFLATGGACELALSADGLAWHARMTLGGVNCWGLAWSGYHWFTVDLSGWAWTSVDGLTWTDYHVTPLSGPPKKVIWDGDRYPADRYLAAGGGIWTSP